ncbi:type VI secretion system contractile sheath small subunit [Mucilaginibacter sp. KACC 22063]|uniref:type VI secretion system contractile sheath small subunit n=1 Tax=Mucilaginibacter sp. KACC 22063 TaxID=3025666 RepID=UPI002365E64B|nr:type VI secretion system contractile sheath small subunit [Mucilaginibacter sp. KACC 22063]WDF54396.1 type VI secretion system contractile sheath small subunit [Mucilaginibacter sp. KACC 22063]
MFNYEIGGNERKVDTSEAFGEIAPNKTLFIQKLTDNEPLRPEKVEGLKTVEEVFEHYKPNVNVALDKQDGSTVTENLKFKNLGDFSVKSLVQQSNYLRKLNIEREMYLSIIKQLKTNKTLKATLDNEETRGAFIDALKNFVKELEQ